MQYPTELSADEVRLYAAGGLPESIQVAAARQRSDAVAAAANAIAAARYTTAAQPIVNPQAAAAAILVNNAQQAALNEQRRVDAYLHAVQTQAAVAQAARNQSLAAALSPAIAHDSSTAAALYHAQVLQDAMRVRDQQQKASEAAVAENELAAWALRLRQAPGNELPNAVRKRATSTGSAKSSSSASSDGEVEIIEKHDLPPPPPKNKSLKRRGSSGGIHTSASISDHKKSATLTSASLQRKKKVGAMKSTAPEAASLKKEKLIPATDSSERGGVMKRKKLHTDDGDKSLGMHEEAKANSKLIAKTLPKSTKKAKISPSSSDLSSSTLMWKKKKSLPKQYASITSTTSSADTIGKQRFSSKSTPKHQHAQQLKQQVKPTNAVPVPTPSMLDRVILSLLIDAGALPVRYDDTLPERITLTTDQLRVIAQRIVHERENAIQNAVKQTMRNRNGDMVNDNHNKDAVGSKDDDDDDDVVTLKVVPPGAKSTSPPLAAAAGEDIPGLENDVDEDSREDKSKQFQTIVQLRRNLQTLIHERGAMRHEIKIMRAHLQDSQRVHRRTLQAYMKASVHALDKIQNQMALQNQSSALKTPPSAMPSIANESASVTSSNTLLKTKAIPAKNNKGSPAIPATELDSSTGAIDEADQTPVYGHNNSF